MPVFNAFKTIMLKKPNNDQEGYNTLLKRLAEVNLALLHCQQSIDVPEIQLTFESAIKEKVTIAKVENRKASMNEMIDYMNDNNFINSLVNCIAKWIQDIGTITKMK